MLKIKTIKSLLVFLITTSWLQFSTSTFANDVEDDEAIIKTFNALSSFYQASLNGTESINEKHYRSVGLAAPNIAAMIGDLDGLKTLKNRGANIGALTLLHSAIWGISSEEDYRTLCNVYETTNQRGACAHAFKDLLATSNGGHHLELIDYLFAEEGEIDINAVIKDGSAYTPLMAACRMKKPEIVAKFLKAGASTLYKNKYNQTALDVAKAAGCNDCVELINQTQIKKPVFQDKDELINQTQIKKPVFQDKDEL